MAADGVASAQEKAAKNLRAESSLGGSSQPLPVTDRIRLVADLDDDDADDRADAQGDFVNPAARADLVTLDKRYAGATLSPVRGREHARLIVNGRSVSWGEKLPLGAQLQGLSPGRTLLSARWPNGRESGVSVDVHSVTMRDGDNRRIDMATQRVSLERTPPARVDLDDVDHFFDDPDALRAVRRRVRTCSPRVPSRARAN